MTFYGKLKMGIILFFVFFLPIQYNLELLKYYSFFICLFCNYEFYNKVIVNDKEITLMYLIYFYWLFFPFIIINFIYDLQDIWNIIMITIFSDTVQQISNRIFVKLYNKQDKFNSLMLYNPFSFLSPNKTIIGYLGGLNTIILYFYFDYSIILILSLYIFGCIGDLLASYFKRINRIKDYSNYLGTHGGFLDRFDSIILNIHFFFIYDLIIQNL